jgi:hypothetical protein
LEVWSLVYQREVLTIDGMRISVNALPVRARPKFHMSRIKQSRTDPVVSKAGHLHASAAMMEPLRPVFEGRRSVATADEKTGRRGWRALYPPPF